MEQERLKYQFKKHQVYTRLEPELLEEGRVKLIHCYIDVETGGFSPSDNPLLQIAGIIHSDTIGIRDRKFNFHIKPFDADQIDPKALAINNLTLEQINEFESPSTVHRKLCDLWQTFVSPYRKTEKMFFVGYNSHSFDMPFVREFFEKCNDKFFGSWFWYPSIDVMLLAAEKLKEERRKMKNFKLSTVAKTLGIKVDEDSLHDAFYDIELTKQVYEEVMK